MSNGVSFVENDTNYTLEQLCENSDIELPVVVSVAGCHVTTDDTEYQLSPRTLLLIQGQTTLQFARMQVRDSIEQTEITKERGNYLSIEYNYIIEICK